MAAMTKSLNIRIDAELKEQAEQILSELGLPTATAVTMFLKSVVRYGGIPFDLRINEYPNSQTVRTMKDVNNKCNLVDPFDTNRPISEVIDSMRESFIKANGRLLTEEEIVDNKKE